MKILRIIGLISTLVLALFIGNRVYLYLGRGTLTITTTPIDTTIVVDKTTYTSLSSKNILLTPGEHNVSISSPGYKTVDQTINMGWKDTINKRYILKLRPLRELYSESEDAADLTGYNIVQEKVFLNDTWVAGYSVPEDEDSNGDISLIIMQRKGDTWRVVLHNDSLPSDASQQLPSKVYEYVKAFGEGNE